MYLYALLVFYVILVLFSWMQMRRLASEACDRVESSVLREVRLRNTRGAVADYTYLLNLSRVYARSLRDETMKSLLPKQLWLCFLVVTSLFVDAETFESEFREEFSVSAVLAAIEYLDTAGHEDLEEFRDVMRAVVVSLEDHHGAD